MEEINNKPDGESSSKRKRENEPDYFNKLLNVDDTTEFYAFDKHDMFRLSRLIMEGLEVALLLCNKYLPQFGPLRLMDLLGQILPSAYILNSSYWPLYQSKDDRCLCFCEIFEIPCLHRIYSGSWLDIKRPLQESVVFKTEEEPLVLKNYKIKILRFKIPDSEDSFMPEKRYYRVELLIKSKHGYETTTTATIDNMDFKIVFRLYFIFPKYRYDDLVIGLEPHPLFLPMYGYYFSKLLDFNNYTNNSMEDTLIILLKNAPKFTVVLKDITITRTVKYDFLAEIIT